MDFTVLFSRIQFGFTIGFHILFPTLNIGLAIFLALMEGAWLKTGNKNYLNLCKFWTKIFALTFGMGVVSGVVMSYELGTNFSTFTFAIGPILGPLFAYEVLSAFFLEAGFLGVMLFGWNRVGPKLHFAATLFVAIGTVLSAFWILSANSWMQTPSGYYFSKGQFLVASWLEAIFNPSFFIRFLHMLFASLVTSCFVVTGVAAWYLLRKRHLDIAKPCFSFALWAALILTPLQVLIGDQVGLKIHEFQPLKTAAMEGNWTTQAGAPLYLFAIPDVKNAKNLFGISIPYGASLFNTHSLTGVLPGLNSAPRSDWPVIPPVFFGFRVMVGLGLLFFFISLYALYLRIKKKLYTARFFQQLCVWVAPLGFVATIAGWMTAESGRQPWIIYNLMRVAQAASKVPPSHVLLTLILFLVVYGIIFIFYLYYLFKYIRKGPKELEESPFTIAYLPPQPPEKEGK